MQICHFRCLSGGFKRNQNVFNFKMSEIAARGRNASARWDTGANALAAGVSRGAKAKPGCGSSASAVDVTARTGGALARAPATYSISTWSGEVGGGWCGAGEEGMLSAPLAPAAWGELYGVESNDIADPRPGA